MTKTSREREGGEKGEKLSPKTSRERERGGGEKGEKLSPKAPKRPRRPKGTIDRITSISLLKATHTPGELERENLLLCQREK